MESCKDEKIKLKFLTMVQSLSYSNFQFFLDQANFSHLIEFLPKNKSDIKLIALLLKIIVNITK